MVSGGTVTGGSVGPRRTEILTAKANNAGYCLAVPESPERVGDDAIRFALLAAAAEVFAESGYEGARVQTIAERAGLTTGAIYNRFSGKSELLLEALEAQTTTVLNDLANAELSATDLLASLGDELVVDDGSASALVLEAFVAARREEGVAERLRPRMADERARLAKLVDADKINGVIDPQLDTTAVVTFCQAVSLGMGMLSAIDSEMPAQSDWRHLIARQLAAVAPDPG